MAANTRTTLGKTQSQHSTRPCPSSVVTTAWLPPAVTQDQVLFSKQVTNPARFVSFSSGKQASPQPRMDLEMLFSSRVHSKESRSLESTWRSILLWLSGHKTCKKKSFSLFSLLYLSIWSHSFWSPLLQITHGEYYLATFNVHSMPSLGALQSACGKCCQACDSLFRELGSSLA